MTANPPRTAFITGGASGFGLALCTRLLSLNYTIFIADLQPSGADHLAFTCNSPTQKRVITATVDVSDWDAQLAAFTQALKEFGGRIDLVAPVAGIGERAWLPLSQDQDISGGGAGTFSKPDLRVLSVDLTGVMYTVSLAVQQFRRQSVDVQGWRGRIALVASICGLWPVPSLPIYSAAKYGVVGLARTYGVQLRREGIRLGAVCPGVAQTGINSGGFYERIKNDGVLVPVEGVVDAILEIAEGDGERGGMVSGREAGEIIVVGPERWMKVDGDEVESMGSEEWMTKSVKVLDIEHRPLH